MRDSVVIIGSGMMGVGIAAVSALAGRKTVLYNKNSESAKAGVEVARTKITELLDNGLAEKEAAEAAAERISAADCLENALEEAELVIEAIVEDLGVKQELFKRLDALLPSDVTIASNTSGLRISDIAAKMEHPERAVTAHFWFPGHLTPLVEVVVGDRTDENKAVALKDELARWGKAPVLVKRDLPGQLCNRLLQAVIREAVNMVAIGLASPEDIDTAVKKGMGIRFPVYGPLEHIDVVGLDLCTSVQNTVLPSLNPNTDANALMKELVEQGNLGVKTGKGIYDWSVKDADDLKKKRDEFIMNVLKMTKESR